MHVSFSFSFSCTARLDVCHEPRTTRQRHEYAITRRQHRVSIGPIDPSIHRSSSCSSISSWCGYAANNHAITTAQIINHFSAKSITRQTLNAALIDRDVWECVFLHFQSVVLQWGYWFPFSIQFSRTPTKDSHLYLISADSYLTSSHSHSMTLTYFYLALHNRTRKDVSFECRHDMRLSVQLRPQPTKRTSWKLVANPGCQLVRICNLGLATSWQLVAN